MWRSLVVMVFLLCVASPAQAAYDHAAGGAATPSSIPAGGGSDYSVSITGKPAAVDIVFVLDKSASMSNALGGGTRWSVLGSATNTFVSNLSAEGFFARGGKVGLVLFSDTATAAATLTTDPTDISNGLASASPEGNSCISCGLQRAAELLAVTPSSHKRLVYVVADGANTVTPPTVSEAVTAANAAGVERRVIGLGSGVTAPDLEALDSDGMVALATTAGEMNSAYAAEPTKLPGATNVSWIFHLAPGFAGSAPVASKGIAAIAGQDVAWTIPSLSEETATLSFHATHAAGSGCSATSLLTGTTFSDAEGDAAPVVGLGPLSLSGCPSPSAGGKTPEPSKLKAGSVISLPKSFSKCSSKRTIALDVTAPKGASVKEVSVKIASRKAKTYTGKKANGKIKLAGLPQGKYQVKVKVTLSDGRTATLTRSYWTCATK